MKEIVITPKRLKTEIATWCACFLIANLCNVYAIVTYNRTSFMELITSLGYVFIFSVFLYAVWSVVRIVLFIVKSFFKK